MKNGYILNGYMIIFVGYVNLGSMEVRRFNSIVVWMYIKLKRVLMVKVIFSIY